MARIRIKASSLEIEYEGEQDFIENRLLDLAEALSSLNPPTQNPGSDYRQQSLPELASRELSTNTLAQLISSKTGSDLALSAIAKINLIKRNATATRSDILDEMKEATTYYKESYASNLTSYLDTLVRSKKVNLVSRSTYALAASERSRFEAVVSGSA